MTEDDRRFAIAHSRGGRSIDWIARHLGICESMVRDALAPPVIERDIDPDTGKAFPYAKLTATDVRWAIQKRLGGKTLSWVASELGVSTSTIRACTIGLTWAYLPGEKIHPIRDGRGISKVNLTAAGAREIRRRFVVNNTPKKQLAREYGISPRHIRDIINYRVWKDV